MIRERDDRMTVYDERMVGMEGQPDRGALELGARSLGSDEERHKVLVAWNDTRTAYPQDRCVPQLVAERAAIAPDAVALVAGSERLTYGELDARSNQVAHYLRAHGVGRETLVGLCLERSAALIVSALGVLKAGAAYLPMDPAYPSERLTFMLHDSRAAVLITQRGLAGAVGAGAWHTLSIDGDAEMLAAQPITAPAGAAAPDDLAYVIYTSGSTGRPKGVEITHRGLLNLVFWHRRAFGVTPDDRGTQVAGPAFDASVWEIWPNLTAGASIYLPDDEVRVALEPLRDWLVANGITITFLPTALAESVMMLPWPAKTRLRFLLTGADTLRHFPSPALPFTLVNNYGVTEASVVNTSGLVPVGGNGGALPSIGRPIDNTRLYILDDAMQPVPIGQPGDLYIGGDGIARGYVGRPDLTAERFVADPFSAEPGARLYKTGDRACYRPDGQVTFLGRGDDQVKIRGYRIEPDEIMAVLNAHAAVTTSLVVAREDTPGEKRLVAYVVPTADHLSVNELRDFTTARLPDYMMPAAFVWLESLPLTPNGKVDRAALPAPDAMNSTRDEGIEAPRTPTEERVAAIVAPLLGVERVSIGDNFFMLGGHSLLGTQLIAQLRESFGVDLTLRGLFESPSVAELSVEVERLIIARLEAMSDDEVVRLLA